jgi:hypothetical protein
MEGPNSSPQMPEFEVHQADFLENQAAGLEPDVELDLAQTAVPPDHSHRWRIEEPHGATSMGQCYCGSKKRFKNFLWETDRISNEEHRVGAGDLSGLDL